MPLVRIDLRRDKPPAYRKAVCDGVYRAMTETFGVPQDDRFMIVNEHDAGNFVHTESYLGVARARVAALLADNPGLRKEDVIINLVECKKENWSFGNGVAQHVTAAS